MMDGKKEELPECFGEYSHKDKGCRLPHCPVQRACYEKKHPLGGELHRSTRDPRPDCFAAPGSFNFGSCSACEYDNECIREIRKKITNPLSWPHPECFGKSSVSCSPEPCAYAVDCSKASPDVPKKIPLSKKFSSDGASVMIGPEKKTKPPIPDERPDGDKPPGCFGISFDNDHPTCNALCPFKTGCYKKMKAKKKGDKPPSCFGLDFDRLDTECLECAVAPECRATCESPLSCFADPFVCLVNDSKCDPCKSRERCIREVIKKAAEAKRREVEKKTPTKEKIEAIILHATNIGAEHLKKITEDGERTLDGKDGLFRAVCRAIAHDINSPGGLNSDFWRYFRIEITDPTPGATYIFEDGTEAFFEIVEVKSMSFPSCLGSKDPEVVASAFCGDCRFQTGGFCEKARLLTTGAPKKPLCYGEYSKGFGGCPGCYTIDSCKRETTHRLIEERDPPASCPTVDDARRVFERKDDA